MNVWNTARRKTVSAIHRSIVDRMQLSVGCSPLVTNTFCISQGLLSGFVAETLIFLCLFFSS